MHGRDFHRYTGVLASQIRGLMSNVIYILRQCKWEPRAYNTWIAPSLDHWVLLDYTSSPDPLISALIKDMQQINLERAQFHHNGGGLQKGLNIHSSMHWHRSMKKADMYPRKCALESVMAVSTWTNARIHAITNHISAMCSRCHNAVDSDFHTYWECPCNADIEASCVVNR